ncbi:YoaK family protein [Bradyrhizobium sp. LB11.1]|uniref:YoaK family protein n=1 Tax=Bradyrhizobium sp. LB11.1 TaxID=3156326 RepID=UPI003395A925
MSAISAEPGDLTREISLRDRLLFTLTVSSGAVDAISFIALGKVFTAFMTGNIAFLGLGISQNPRAPSTIAVLASMAGFAIGIYLGTRIVVRRPSGSEQYREPLGAVWPQQTTYALGLSLLGHVGFVLIWLATDARPGANATLALLVVWAIAMGMQSGAVRRLNVSGVFTTAATATFIFVVGDLAHEPLTGEERHRLRAVLASLVIGATAGGLLLLHARLYAPLLPFLITAWVVATATRAFGSRYGSHRGG